MHIHFQVPVENIVGEVGGATLCMMRNLGIHSFLLSDQLIIRIKMIVHMYTSNNTLLNTINQSIIC